MADRAVLLPGAEQMQQMKIAKTHQENIVKMMTSKKQISIHYLDGTKEEIGDVDITSTENGFFSMFSSGNNLIWKIPIGLIKRIEEKLI